MPNPFQKCLHIQTQQRCEKLNIWDKYMNNFVKQIFNNSIMTSYNDITTLNRKILTNKVFTKSLLTKPSRHATLHNVYSTLV